MYLTALYYESHVKDELCYNVYSASELHIDHITYLPCAGPTEIGAVGGNSA